MVLNLCGLLLHPLSSPMRTVTAAAKTLVLFRKSIFALACHRSLPGVVKRLGMVHLRAAVESALVMVVPRGREVALEAHPHPAMAAVERALAKVASRESVVALAAHPHPADNGSTAIAALEPTVGSLMTDMRFTLGMQVLPHLSGEARTACG